MTIAAAVPVQVSALVPQEVQTVPPAVVVPAVVKKYPIPQADA